MNLRQSQIRILLLQYIQESHQTSQKYMPDKLGSDAYRAEMIACLEKYANEICKLFEDDEPAN